MNYIDVTEKTFDTEVLKSDIPVVVDFWAAWCGPCKAFAPVFAETAGEYTGRVKFCKIDCDDNQELAQRYGVMSIPCLLIFKNGILIRSEAGMRPKAKLKELIDAVI